MVDLRPYAQKILRWKRDPVAFVREVLRAEPDVWQRRVLEAISSNQRVAMKACKGPGKSCLMAWVTWWFLLTRKDSKVVATSITEDNLKDGLWSEMRLWQGKSDLLTEMFQWTSTRITCKERPEVWFASARTWAKDADKTQQANTLAGIHADNVLFVLDEVSEYPDGVVIAAEGGLTSGAGCKIVVAGNPTRVQGPLYRIFTRDKKFWWTIEITGDPDRPDRASRVDIEWARKQIAEWGREANVVKTNVLGEFPSAQADTLIGADLVNQAAERFVKDDLITEWPRILGVDPARYGDDRIVLFPRQGPVAYLPTVYRELSTMETAGQVLEYDHKWQPDAIFIDVGGMGAGIYDRLRELGHDHVIGVDLGSKPLRRGSYNRRAELYKDCRDWLKSAAIPNDPELIAELTAPTYKFMSDGRMVLESKDDLKKRTGTSPDKADALVITFAAPVQKRSRYPVKQTGAFAGDYDPIETFREERATWGT